MNYAKIREIDIANGEGLRTSLYVSGCTHNCKGCFNPETHDFNYGKKWTKEIQEQFIELTNRPEITGATILGGEPMHPNNILPVAGLILDIRHRCPNKSIWVYSGFKYEDLLKRAIAKYYILPNIDILIDGKFVEDLKNPSLRFKGSSNQRIIDVQKSLRSGKVELYNLK